MKLIIFSLIVLVIVSWVYAGVLNNQIKQYKIIAIHFNLCRKNLERCNN
jgi:hypothetical protein